MSAATRDFAWLAALGTLGLVGLASFGVLDYDEAAYAEVARRMVTSGDWLVPHLCGDPFYEKPPLLYWVQALGYAAFGVGELGARIGTALAGAASPIVLWAFARRPLGERAAFLAALALASALEFSALAHVAFTDMLLLLWLTLCTGALHRAFETPERGLGWFLVACAASALAMLTKGAIGLLIPGGVALVHLLLLGRLREMVRPTWIALGAPLVLGLGFSWYLLLGVTQPGGFGFMRDLFLEHHLGRFSEPMQGHAGSVLYYLPVLLVGLLPWSPFAPLALARASLRGDDERARFLRLFALLSAVVVAFFSIAATKLPNYVAPAFPGLALLVGDLFARHDGRAGDRAFAASLATALALVGLLAVVLAISPLLPPIVAERMGERAERLPGLEERFALGAAPVLAALALAVSGIAAFVAFRARRSAAILVALAAGSICAYAVVFAGVMPSVDAHLWAPLRRLAAHAAERTPSGERIVMIGLRRRASVCFYTGRETVQANREAAFAPDAPLFRPEAGRVGLTRERLLSRFPPTVRVRVLERDSGYVLFHAGPGDAGR